MPSNLKRFQNAESLHVITLSRFHRIPLRAGPGDRSSSLGWWTGIRGDLQIRTITMTGGPGMKGQWKSNQRGRPKREAGMTSGKTATVVSAGAAIAGRFTGGVTKTDTTKPMNVVKFTGFTSLDFVGYLMRRPCE